MQLFAPVPGGRISESADSATDAPARGRFNDGARSCPIRTRLPSQALRSGIATNLVPSLVFVLMPESESSLLEEHSNSQIVPQSPRPAEPPPHPLRLRPAPCVPPCGQAGPRRTRSCSSATGQAQLRCNCILVHLAFGELRQFNIGLLFLFETLVQKSLVIAQVQLTGQTRRRAISSDLVMLDFLC